MSQAESAPNMCEKSSGKKIIISINPNAGHGPSARQVERLAELLGDDGFELVVLGSLDEVERTANLWHKQGLLWVLVGVGGDGTAAELVNRTEAGVPILMLASGTENLLAKYIGWSQSPEQLHETIVAGRLKVFDAARAGERIFLLMIGCGFDADVVRRVDASRTGAHHPLVVFLAYSHVAFGVTDTRSYWYTHRSVAMENMRTRRP